MPLLRQLKKFRPEFQSPILTREYLYDALFSGKGYKASVMNSSLSRLNVMAEEYLLQIGLEENHYMIKERLLINQLGSRGLKKRAERLIMETQIELNHKPEEPFDFSTKKEVAIEISSFYSVSNMRQKHVQFLEKSRRYIVYSFLSELAFFESTEIAGRNAKRSGHEVPFEKQIIREIDFDAIMEVVKNNDEKNFRFLNLYYLLMKSAKDQENSANYFNFKTAAFELMDEMSVAMRRFVLNTLGVLSSLYVVSGKSEFRKESFEIKKKSVEENLFAFSTSGYPKISEFRSTFIDALNEKEYEWAENFCEKFIGMIHPDDREDIRNYYKSRLYYEKGDHDIALKLASRVNMNQITFKLDMKNLLSKIHYDTESFESLALLLDSYSKLLGRQGSKTGTLQLRHRRFVAYLKKLMLFRERHADEYQLLTFKKKIATDNFTSKTWLIERLDKLLSK
jgi:hypothetical protein